MGLKKMVKIGPKEQEFLFIVPPLGFKLIFALIIS